MMFVDWFDGLSVAGCGMLYVAGLFWLVGFAVLIALWSVVVWVFDGWMLLRLVIVCVDLISAPVNSVGIIRSTFYFELYFGLVMV